jgi:uncharacterized membrane protein
LTQQEILEDPNDSPAKYLIKFSNDFFTNSNAFAIVYLIFHGVFNIFLVAALLKNKIWAYPWVMVGFGVFIIYQTYRYFHTYSLMLLFLTAFDIFIVLIVWLEYRRKQNFNQKIINN